MSAKRRAGWVSAAEWRWFWTIALILAGVTGGVTALAAWLGRPEEPKYLLPSQSPFRKDLVDTIPKQLDLHDFDLPAPGGEWLSRPWLYSREKGSSPWSWNQLQPYWTAPGDLSEATLPDRNDRQIQAWLGETP